MEYILFNININLNKNKNVNEKTLPNLLYQ